MCYIAPIIAHAYWASQFLQTSNSHACDVQDFPDAINIPSFPSMVLRPGQTYTNIAVWRFSNVTVSTIHYKNAFTIIYVGHTHVHLLETLCFGVTLQTGDGKSMQQCNVT